ncbi:MAG: hypothetical protein JWP12_356 [Bacteroidetes bacterium]|nr:hypothetical protein [Bacteroidota bacterium]
MNKAVYHQLWSLLQPKMAVLQSIKIYKNGGYKFCVR